MSKKQDWIREQPCAICGISPPSEASHVTVAANRGIGIKPTDEFLIPACNSCHRLEHTHGRSEVLKRKRHVIFDRWQARDFYLKLAERYEKMWKALAK